MQQRPRPWQEVIVGVLCIDSSLEGVSSEKDVVLEKRQALPCRHLVDRPVSAPRGHRASERCVAHPELPLHQVCSCDHLRHGMLHLQPGVHLHEVEVVLGVHDELDGT